MSESKTPKNKCPNTKMGTISCKQISSLRKDEIKRCKSLNFGWEGSMSDTFSSALRDQTRDHLVVLCEDEGTMLGWALLILSETGAIRFQVYVRKAYRRKGIGKRLLEAGKASFPEKIFLIAPHDEPSCSFYMSTAVSGFDIDPAFAIELEPTYTEPLLDAWGIYAHS
jgi:GNAT superfamily N-acetyltransferase